MRSSAKKVLTKYLLKINYGNIDEEEIKITSALHPEIYNNAKEICKKYNSQANR